MLDLFRDTIFGQLVRLASGGRLLRYEEEIDPSIWKKYLNEEKSRNMAIHGSTEPPKATDDPEKDAEQAAETSPASSTSVLATNEIRGKIVDSEKGRDVHIVDWYGVDDPEAAPHLHHYHFPADAILESNELVSTEEILCHL
jgi:MFS transporter, DHA1 family, multidrug resistance protein